MLYEVITDIGYIFEGSIALYENSEISSFIDIGVESINNFFSNYYWKDSLLYNNRRFRLMFDFKDVINIPNIKSNDLHSIAFQLTDFSKSKQILYLLQHKNEVKVRKRNNFV